jgi:hypothetical protein
MSSKNSMEIEERRRSEARTGLKKLENTHQKMYHWILLFITLIVGWVQDLGVRDLKIVPLEMKRKDWLDALSTGLFEKKMVREMGCRG